MNTKWYYCPAQALLVDFVFFLYKTGESMLDATTRPYLVKLTCLGMYAGNATVCRNLDQLPLLEDSVQANAANYLMVFRLLLNIPAVILGLFCGAWSDRYGRKIPMILPGLGSVFAVLLYMLSLVAEDMAMPMILAGATVQGLFGKSSVITMAVNSYASDITDKEDRTKKLGKLLAMNFFGLFFGSLLSGLLQDLSDMQVTFFIVILVHTIGVLVTVCLMEESIEPTLAKPGEPKRSECFDIFRISNVKDSFLVLGKRRTSNTRFLIVILFVTSIVNQTCKVGEMDVTVLFVSRSPLNWPRSWYGYLLSVDYAVMALCLFLVLPVLSNLLKTPDILIIILGLSCKIVRLIWAAFCRESWMVYSSVVVGAFAGLITSSLRSLLSKAVDEDELGKIFSLLASGETASKLFGVVIFVNLYGATAPFFPGFTYLIEALVYVVVLVLMVWLYNELKVTGTYNLLQAISPQKLYGSYQPRRSITEKEVVDELEEEPTFPQPLPATTP